MDEQSLSHFFSKPKPKPVPEPTADAPPSSSAAADAAPPAPIATFAAFDAFTHTGGSQRAGTASSTVKDSPTPAPRKDKARSVPEEEEDNRAPPKRPRVDAPVRCRKP
jgi:hypothetical protein